MAYKFWTQVEFEPFAIKLWGPRADGEAARQSPEGSVWCLVASAASDTPGSQRPSQGRYAPWQRRTNGVRTGAGSSKTRCSALENAETQAPPHDGTVLGGERGKEDPQWGSGSCQAAWREVAALGDSSIRDV